MKPLVNKRSSSCVEKDKRLSEVGYNSNMLPLDSNRFAYKPRAKVIRWDHMKSIIIDLAFLIDFNRLKDVIAQSELIQFK